MLDELAAPSVAAPPKALFFARDADRAKLAERIIRARPETSGHAR